MLPFNALSNKPFIKFMAPADPSYSVSFCTFALGSLLHIFTKLQAEEPCLTDSELKAQCSCPQLARSSGQTVNDTMADSVLDDLPFLFISRTRILSKQTALSVQHSFSSLCRSGSHATDFGENRDGSKSRTG